MLQIYIDRFAKDVVDRIGLDEDYELLIIGSDGQYDIEVRDSSGYTVDSLRTMHTDKPVVEGLTVRVDQAIRFNRISR
jgi:hypothetical protein